MKYKTVSLSYANGEENLINSMSKHGYGLINRLPPDYTTGKINAYYTFCGSDNSPEIDHVDFKGDVFIEPPQRLGFLGRIQKFLNSSK